MRKNLLMISFAALILGMVVVNQSATAQANLVLNGDMESGFSARDNVTGVPLGWAFYVLSGTPDADRQAFAPYAHSAPTFWAMRDTYSSWVAGGYQSIAVTPGITYRMGAFAFIWTCNDNQYSCIGQDGVRWSHKESNMRVRIGIDPNSGTDPNSGEIVWGPWAQPWDGYQGLTVDATATGDYVTIFLQADSGAAMAFNEAYWDDVTLVAITTTPAAPQPNQPAVVAAPPSNPVPAAEVPFVSPQQARPDGSVVHRVQPGDTFYSILVAYTNLGITKESVLQLNGWRFEPDIITIGQEILILPPGAVDPATGQVLIANAGAAPPQLPTPVSAEAAPAPAQPAVGAAGAAPAAPEALRRLTAAEIAALSPVEAVNPFLP